eukprot:maker-scaffold_6-snap-gene-17.27-mRNA-1 protein AED:0.18 eAED:0.33 QI:0/0/0/1/0/0/2/0/119
MWKASSLLMTLTTICFVPDPEDAQQEQNIQLLSAINVGVVAIKFTTCLGSVKKENPDAWIVSVIRGAEEKEPEKSNLIIVLSFAPSHSKLKSEFLQVNSGVVFLRLASYALLLNPIEPA